MANFFTRQSAAYGNQMRQSCSVLIGLATGLVADQTLNDTEIRFLAQWLEQHDEIASVWPGDVLHQRIKAVLADGVITEEERAHLMQTLTLLIGGQLESLATSPRVNKLAMDDVHEIAFDHSSFCLTGTFAFGPRNACEHAILKVRCRPACWTPIIAMLRSALGNFRQTHSLDFSWISSSPGDFPPLPRRCF
jgi:hypothetical protein